MPSTVRATAGPLLGRDTEVELVTTMLDGVDAAGSTLVLRGEPGIGKSRLIAEAVRLAGERDITVLQTTGVEAEAHLPFAGLHQLVRPVRAHAANLAPAPRAALDAAFGVGDDEPPEQFRIAMAGLDLLSDVATDAPLLVTIDDGHWIDRPSAAVAAFVAPPRPPRALRPPPHRVRSHRRARRDPRGVPLGVRRRRTARAPRRRARPRDRNCVAGHLRLPSDRRRAQPGPPRGDRQPAGAHRASPRRR